MSDCVFCKIASGEIKGRMVYQDEDVVAFEDIAPQSPTHILFIPREHADRISDMDEEKLMRIMPKIFGAISRVVKSMNLSKGFRVVLNQGSEAGQAVAHLHFHLLAGRRLSWPPG